MLSQKLNEKSYKIFEFFFIKITLQNYHKDCTERSKVWLKTAVY